MKSLNADKKHERRGWPAGAVFVMLAIDIAVGVYLFVGNNVWNRSAFKEKMRNRVVIVEVLPALCALYQLVFYDKILNALSKRGTHSNLGGKVYGQ